MTLMDHQHQEISVFDRAEELGVFVKNRTDLVALIEEIHRRESQLMGLRHRAEQELIRSPPGSGDGPS